MVYGILACGGGLLIALILGGAFWHRIWSIQRVYHREALDRWNRRRLFRRSRRGPQFVVELPTIRDFVLTLQLSLSLAETLAGALTQAARQFGERGVFGERLTARVKSQLTVEPEKVIRSLAEDFGSEHLLELAERLDMAHQGGLSYFEAVSATLDDIEEEIALRVEREIERAPVVLTIPMIVGVFFMALVLVAYPLLANLVSNIASIAAVGAGG
jgi:hypothetical protein